MMYIYIAGGSARLSKEGIGYNSGFLICPDGQIAAVQDKIHLIAMEKRRLTGGDRIALWDTPLARIGFVLCNDIFYPETARCIALQGAEIIFAPSIIGGTGVLGLETAARARAIENQVYLVNANGIPLEAKKQYPNLPMGRSGIYSPFLEKIDMVRAGTEESTIRCLLDMEDLEELKNANELSASDHMELAEGKSFNMLAGRRPELYSAIVDKL